MQSNSIHCTHNINITKQVYVKNSLNRMMPMVNNVVQWHILYDIIKKEVYPSCEDDTASEQSDSGKIAVINKMGREEMLEYNNI